MLIAICVSYTICLGAIVALSMRRSRGAELAKATSVSGSLAVLCLAGIWRVQVLGGSAIGGVLWATELSVSLILATGLDPMNAIVNWPGDASRERVAYSLLDDTSRTRRKAAWPSLLAFVFIAGLTFMLLPSLYW